MDSPSFRRQSMHKRRDSANSPKRALEASQMIRKSSMRVESDIDKGMKHWEEYRVKGLKIPRRSYHTSVFHNNTFYVYGGYEVNSGILSDFLKVNLDPSSQDFQWEEVVVNSALKPGPRCRHSAITYKDKMYLFGGQINAVENTNRLMTFDFTNNQWLDVECNGKEHQPSIDSHVALLWERDDKASMIVLGGFLSGASGGYTNAVYEYDLINNTWNTLFKHQEVDNSENKNPTVPEGRVSLGAAISNNVVYMFGGNEESVKMNDLWKFDLVEKFWSPVKVQGDYIPEPRNGHSLIAYKNLLILFGGILDITHEKNDISVYHLIKNTWSAVEKDTQWIFQEVPQGTAENFNKGFAEMSQSPKRKVTTTKKKSEAANESFSSANDDSPGQANKTNLSKFVPQQQSPTKFAKVKLLMTPPKGVFSTKDMNNTKRSDWTVESKEKSPNHFKSSTEERLMREKELKKMMLLKEFEVEADKEQDFKTETPALETMERSIKSLGLSDKKEKGGESGINITLAGLEAIRQQAGRNTDEELSVKVGVKPVPRDGHSVAVNSGKMFVFAGDRHKMSFNDLFALNLRYFDAISY